MKKIFKISIFLALVLFCLSACRTPAEWQKSDEIQSGIYAVEVVKDSESSITWYATVDSSTDTVLSINLIYPKDLGEPGETSAAVNGKSLKITKSMADREEGGVLFFVLPYEYMTSDCGDEIEIIQSFSNGEETVYYRPSDIFTALTANENE